MRVLFVTPRFPSPQPRGDQARAFHHLRELSRRHELTLLAVADEPPDAAARAELSRCCARIEVVPQGRAGRALRIVRALPGAVPLQVAMYDAGALRDRLAALLDAVPFDLAHLQLSRLGLLAPRLGALPAVVDFVDSLALNMARRAQYDRGPMRLLARLEADRLARYEPALCDAVAGAAVCSADDREALGSARVALVPNGVDLERFAFVPPAARATRVVFVGNLGYFANVDAAAWFVREALPRVRARVPDAVLDLVGARPARVLRRLAREREGVALVGPVPAVHPYLARAAVAIAPLRAGTGQQLKVLEAMASGTPVVASALAAAALDARDGVQLLVADGAAATADAVVRLLEDRALGLRLAHAARAWVEARHSWAVSAAALERVWVEAAGRVSAAVAAR